LEEYAIKLAAARKHIQFGISTSIENTALMKSQGWDLVEEKFQNILQREQNESKLPVLAANVLVPGALKLTGPAVDNAAIDAHLNRVIERAKAYGIKKIVFGSGGARKVPDGFSQDEAWKQLVEFAKRIGPLAKKRGIVVAVEPLQKGETNTINSAAEGLKWVKAVNHPNFQLMVDFYHLSLENEDAAILVSARKNIKHIHIANPAGRRFPMSADEFDYSKFFTALKKAGYKGGVSVEGRSDDYATEAPKAVAFLRGAVTEGVKAPSGPTPAAFPAGGGGAKPATPTSTAPVPPAGAPAAPAPAPAK
jgi:sugar phosphate isomerase/epimerase